MFGLGLLQTSAIGLCIMIGLGAGSYAYGYERGKHQAELAAAKAQIAAVTKAALDARALGIAEGTITITAGKHFAEVQTRIVTRTITQVREVPVYVTQKANDACIVPLGFIRLFNIAASGPDTPADAFPVPAGLTNDTPTAIELTTVASALADNFGRYHGLAASDSELIGWIKKQQTLHP